MKRVNIKGTCGVCGEEGDTFVSASNVDTGPWTCENCVKIVGQYLAMTGYVLVLPVPNPDTVY